MTKSELEAKISRLKNELGTIMAGHGAYNLLRQYAKDLGTGYTAFERAKDTVERIIAQTEKDLAALPPPSKFQEAKDRFEQDWDDVVAEMGELGTYVTMLEACRPWVIRRKYDGYLWEFRNGHMAMFAQESEAKDYRASVPDAADYEVVQWEGSQ